MTRTENDLREAFQTPLDEAQLARLRHTIAGMRRTREVVPGPRRRWVTPLVAAAGVAVVAAGAMTVSAVHGSDHAAAPGGHTAQSTALLSQPSKTSDRGSAAPTVTRTSTASATSRSQTAQTQSATSGSRSTTAVVPARIAGTHQSRTTYFTLAPGSGFLVGSSGLTDRYLEVRNILLADGSESGAAVGVAEGPTTGFPPKPVGAPAISVPAGSAYWVSGDSGLAAGSDQVLVINLPGGNGAMVIPSGDSASAKTQAVEIAQAFRPATITGHLIPAVFGAVPAGFTDARETLASGTDSTPATGTATAIFGRTASSDNVLVVQFNALTSDVSIPQTAGPAVTLGGRAWHWNADHTILVSRGTDCVIVIAGWANEGPIGGPLPTGITSSDVEKMAAGIHMKTFSDMSTWVDQPIRGN